MAPSFVKLTLANELASALESSTGPDPEAAIRDALGRIESKIHLPPELTPSLGRLQPLAQTLGQFAEGPDALQVGLVDASQDWDANSGPANWTLKVDANSGLQIRVLDDAQRNELNLGPRDGLDTLGLAAVGNLGMSGAGSAKVNPWSVKSHAQTSSTSSIEWWWDAPTSRRVGSAMLDALPLLASPVDLLAQLAISDGAGGNVRYRGCCMRLSGQLAAGIEVSADPGMEGWTWGFDGDKSKLVWGAQCAGRAAISLAGDFILTCRPVAPPIGDAGGLEVTLSRARTAERSLGLDLTLGLDASALAASADKFLQANAPHEAEMEALRLTLLNAGQVSAQALADKLHSQFLEAPWNGVVKLATGLLDRAEAAKAAAQRLSSHWLEQLVRRDPGTGGASTDPQWTRWLEVALPQADWSDDQSNLLVSLAQRALSESRDELNTALNGLSERLAGKAAEEGQRLLRPLGTLGTAVLRQLTTSRGAELESARAAVKAGWQDYVNIRARVLKALDAAQRSRLTASFTATATSQRHSEEFFRGHFIRADRMVAAQALYHALCTGRLSNLVELVQAAINEGSLGEDVEGWLIRAFRRHRASSVQINLLGTVLTEKFETLDQIDLKVDVNGEIFARVEGSAQADIVNRWHERHASLRVSLTRQPVPAGFVIELSLHGEFFAAGQAFDRRDVDAMQRSLAAVTGAMPIDLQALASAQGTVAGSSQLLKDAAVALPIDMNTAEFSAFLAVDAATLRRNLTRFGLLALDAEFDDALGDLSPGRLLKGLAQSLREQRKIPVSECLEQLVETLARFPPRWGRSSAQVSNIDYERIGLSAAQINTSSPLHRALGLLWKLSAQLRAICELQQHCRALRNALTESATTDLAALEGVARQHLLKLTTCLKSFALAGATLAGNDKTASWPFVAFASTMALACGRAVPPGFVPLLVPQDGRGDPVPLLA